MADHDVFHRLLAVTDDSTAVAGPTDSAMGHSSTAITVTNVGDESCLMLMLDWNARAVWDVELGGDSAVQTDCGGAFSGWSVAPR